MADVNNGGGYGRFYQPAESTTGATTATSKVTNTISNISSTVSSSVGAKLDDVKKAASQGFPINTAIAGKIPGVEVFDSVAASRQDVNLAASFDQGQTKTTPPSDFKVPLVNQLEQYASYNTIFTLSALSDEAINFPDLTYKKGQLGPIILKSGSGAPADQMVKTAFGVFDFFIDDVKVSSTIGLDSATGGTNATGVSFKVIEPYSMGLFFQAIQTAALELKTTSNYLDVPILLTIEWKGWTDLNQETPIVIRQIPLKLRELGMTVTGRGCEYTVEAYPWNEQALSTSYNEAKSDIGIQCDPGGPYTVQNLLQTGKNSLQAVLNERFKKAAADKKVEYPDEIIILFPTDLTSDPSSQPSYSNEYESSATVNPSNSAGPSAFYTKLGVSQGNNATKVQGESESSVNPIGKSKLGFNEQNKGETTFIKDADAYDKEKGVYKKGSINIDVNNCSFKFTQAAMITDMITQVLLMSDYGRNALDEAKTTDKGEIIWFRIDTQVYNIPNLDLKTGIKPKCCVFRVVPFKVDAARFQPPNTKKEEKKIENKKKQALKEYNYIYTGKNVDILDFQIDFSAGFYTALFAPGTPENQVLEDKTGQASDANNGRPPDATTLGLAAGSPALQGNQPSVNETPTVVRQTNTKSSSAKLGRGGLDSPSTTAARQFHDAINAQQGMINLNLTIIGDPYYIADSGMGNYSAKSMEGYDNITADGSIDYQSGEVVIQVNFRTPIDIDLEKGAWDFRDGQPVGQFSGLFQVLSVESSISRNKFTQVLKLMRLPGQDKTQQDSPNTTLVGPNNPPATDFVTSTNNSILNSPMFSKSGVNQINNTNPSAPDTGLPGVINTGGVTI